MEMAPNERLASKEDRVGREEPLNLVLRNAWCSLANVRRVVCRRVVVSDLIVYKRGEHSPESRLSREARKSSKTRARLAGSVCQERSSGFSVGF